MLQDSGHRLIPHTADMGIEAWAADLDNVFIAAAQGLKNLMFGSATIAAQKRCAVNLSAADNAELMVVWLNEILYQFEVESLVPAKFEIDTLDKAELKAFIHGELYNPMRHHVQHQVKAVTYHQLTLERKSTGWYTKVYVDL